MKTVFAFWAFSLATLASCQAGRGVFEMPKHASWTEIGNSGTENNPPVKYIIDGKDWCAVLVLKTRTFVAADVRGQRYCTDPNIDLRGFPPFEQLLPAFDAINNDRKRGKNASPFSSNSVKSNGKSASLLGEFDAVLGFPKQLVWQIDGEVGKTTVFYSDFKRLTHTEAMNAIAKRIKGIPRR